MAVKEYQII